MSVVHFIIVALFTFILLVKGNPVDPNDKYEIVVCPENGLLDGVVIYPREDKCSRVGGLCVEKNKCRSLVSASGLCPISQAKGVECCFELEPQYEICHHQL